MEIAIEELSDIVSRLEREPLGLAPAPAAADSKTANSKSSKSKDKSAGSGGSGGSSDAKKRGKNSPLSQITAGSEVYLFAEQFDRCVCCRHWMHKNLHTSANATKLNESLDRIEHRAVSAIKSEFMKHAQTAIHEPSVITGLQQLLTLLEILRPSTAGGKTRDRDELISKVLGVRWMAYSAVFDPERHWTSTNSERAEAVRLGSVSRRWLWIERQLREYDTHFGRVVPSSWHVRRQLLLGFAELTHKHLTYALQHTYKPPVAASNTAASEFSAALDSVIEFEVEHRLNVAIVTPPPPAPGSAAANAAITASKQPHSAMGGAAVPMPPSLAHPIARAFVPFLFVLVERERQSLLSLLAAPNADDKKAESAERWDSYDVPNGRVVSPPRFNDRIFVQLKAALARVTTKLPVPLRDVQSVNAFVRVIQSVLQRYANLLHARTVQPNAANKESSAAKRFLSALSPSSGSGAASGGSDELPKREDLIINCVIANTSDYVLELIPALEKMIESLRATLTTAASKNDISTPTPSPYAKYSAPALSPVSAALAEYDSYRDAASDVKSKPTAPTPSSTASAVAASEPPPSEFEAITNLFTQTLSGAIAAIVNTFEARCITGQFERLPPTIATTREAGDVSPYMKRVCAVLESDDLGIPLCGRIVCDGTTAHVSLLNAMFGAITTRLGAALAACGGSSGARAISVTDTGAHQLRIDLGALKTTVINRLPCVKLDGKGGVTDPAKNSRLARYQKFAATYFGRIENLLKAVPAIALGDTEPDSKLSIISELIPKGHVTDVAWIVTVRQCMPQVIDWTLVQYNALVPTADQTQPLLSFHPARPIPTTADKPALLGVPNGSKSHRRVPSGGESNAASMYAAAAAGGGGGGGGGGGSGMGSGSAPSRPQPAPSARPDPYAHVDPNAAYAAAGGAGPKAVVIEDGDNNGASRGRSNSPDAMTKIKNFFSF